MKTRIPLLLLVLPAVLAACGGDEDPLADVEGTYHLDRDALANDLLQERLDRFTTREREALGAEQRRRMTTEVRAVAAESDIRLDLLADGSFVIRYRYGDEEGRRRGSWRRSERRILLRTTETTAGPVADPTEVTAEWQDSALRFHASGVIPHSFTLRRR